MRAHFNEHRNWDVASRQTRSASHFRNRTLIAAANELPILAKSNGGKLAIINLQRTALHDEAG
jgi:hypothetical protein